MKVIAVLVLTGLLAGCATKLPPFTGAQGLTLNPYRVHIKWQTADRCKIETLTEDPTICVGLGGAFCVGRNDFIIWTSENPSDARYEIFFDPFYGPRMKSNANGLILKVVDPKAPIANYKYSIVRRGCDPTAANTYDPHIRIDH